MPSIPNPFLGRNISSLAIVPGTIDATGSWSDGTSKSILAVSENIRKTQRNELENISAINARRKNYVIIESETQYVIEGFILANDATAATSTTNPVNNYVQVYDYLKLTFGRAGLTDTFYSVVESYEEQWVKGKCTFTLTVTMVDPGTANPVLT